MENLETFIYIETKKFEIAEKLLKECEDNILKQTTEKEENEKNIRHAIFSILSSIFTLEFYFRFLNIRDVEVLKNAIALTKYDISGKLMLYSSFLLEENETKESLTYEFEKNEKNIIELKLDLIDEIDILTSSYIIGIKLSLLELNKMSTEQKQK